MECIIIDDEDFSIQIITSYIDLFPQINLKTFYTDPRIALQELMNAPPFDILFLDIDMPGMSGLELARALRHKIKKLIFTTSHSKYAFEAFEVEADAFLLKPFSFTKFSLTIARLIPGPEAGLTGYSKEYFFIKNKDEDLRIVKIQYSEVAAFESVNNYVKIHLSSGKTLTAYLGLKDINELVKQRENFKQLHRAFIVSTDKISYIEGNTVHLDNNLVLTVGDRYKGIFGDFIRKSLVTTSRNKKAGDD